MKRLSMFFCLCLLVAGLLSQAQSNGKFSTKTLKSGKNTAVRELLESLVGQGIVLKNFSVSRTPANDAFGFFEDPEGSLGMKKGLLMASGSISGISSSNTSPGYSDKTVSHLVSTPGQSDAMVLKEDVCPELAGLLKNGLRTFDVCVLELDIVPTADTLSFNYVFGSDEYDEYVGSMFNDVFGFFISGKGITGERNLAVVPGTEIPVSINTINGGNSEEMVKASNSTYYVRNTDGRIAIEYDGMTRLMQIRQPVIPYESYHLKIAIADVSDGAFDSGVFIEGKSFLSYDRSYNVLFTSNSSTIDEGYETMLKNIISLYHKKPAGERGKMLITGHTDGDGSPELNDALSAARAEEVYDYLKRRGVDENNMVVLSKGENMPRADNFNDAGKHLNRRVEVKMCGDLNKYEKAKKEEIANSDAETSYLTDNYPNPFSASTTVRAFIRPEIMEATLNITDVKGNQVRSIHVLERGTTETYFGSENLPSGIYVCSMILDGAPAGSIKLIIQK